MKKIKCKQRKLTYEEHKRIHEFLKHFYEEGQEVFKLLRQSFGDYGIPVKRMAKAANLMSGLHHYCKYKASFDRPIPMELDPEEFNKWQSIYSNIGLWRTTGWENK